MAEGEDNYQLLNGTWKFKWVERPDQVPKNFEDPDFNTEAWDEIKVPSNWQMDGIWTSKIQERCPLLSKAILPIFRLTITPLAVTSGPLPCLRGGKIKKSCYASKELNPLPMFGSTVRKPGITRAVLNPPNTTSRPI